MQRAMPGRGGRPQHRLACARSCGMTSEAGWLEKLEIFRIRYLFEDAALSEYAGVEAGQGVLGGTAKPEARQEQTKY